MHIEESFERIRACGVMAVIRGIREDDLRRTIEAVLAGGVCCVEIAMSVRGALKDIARLAQEFGADAVIGAGEVLNAEMAQVAMVAGSHFCTGIGANVHMIRACHRRDTLAIPGALTPTEIQAAWHEGASLIKVFPGNMVGPEYLETVRGPLPRVELMVSGGVTPETAPAFIRSGAVAIGAGRGIIDAAAIAEGKFDQITHSARRMFEAVQSARP